MQGEGGLFDYMLLIVSLFLDLAGLRGVSRRVPAQAHVYITWGKLLWSSTGGRGRRRQYRWSSTGGEEGGEGVPLRVKEK